MLGSTPSEAFYSAATVFRSIPTCVKNIIGYLNVADRQTTYCGITALCVASRGKNPVIAMIKRAAVNEA